MLINNKYKNWYDKIIKNANSELRSKKENYYEKHHIIPKSIGGNNQSENLVLLTAREHYLCHKLLTKFTDGEDKKKMFYALWAFNRTSNNQERFIISSRDYEYARKHVSRIFSKARMGQFAGTKLTEEHKKKISNTLKGRVVSEKTKERMRNSWKSRPARTEAHCNAISEANKGKTHTEETKKKMSLSKKGKNPVHTQVAWVCNHCNKTGIGISNYNRWHGDNCKRKTDV
jgi:hypothetical protein